MSGPQLRTGRRVGRHVYWQDGPEPADTDPYVCTAETEALAAEIVDAVNERWVFDGIPAGLRPCPNVTPPE